MSEVEDLIKKIANQRGVTGCMVFNNQGIIIRTTLEQSLTIHYAALITQLCNHTKNTVKKLDDGDDLTFIRLRTTKNEILVAPGFSRIFSSHLSSLSDRDYILVVIQVPVV
ncbi:putative Dynein light chain roadblock-type 2 [Blattamonas nauphoetae]|uniref:Dynein light chain roadblock n=1 Tax=Blattamonas nauphoetae TaxID=2049346 RepID=A0ABQ9YHD2_9EUKA|nr:putative Dynein light chain roadblock-type 2 [Blattamonas nauphoetae]